MNQQLTCNSADKRKYWRLWRLAKPYLDTRKNEIHTRISVGLAMRLLEKERGTPDVVIPAVILHDVGWKQIPEELQLTAFGPKASAPELNRSHEIQSVKIARALLKKVSYDRLLTGEILFIIDGHDSRPEAVSKNDALVKDADKLWRYTPDGFGIDIERFGETYQEGLIRLQDNLEHWFLTASGKQYARTLLSKREKENDTDG